ncbi:YbaB/EbfC family nucleoid-associated protein [Patescibacteria group bacterium]
MMNPFKMLGDMNQMRKQAGAIQAMLEKEEVEGKDGMVRVVMNGNQQVKLVEIDGVENDSVKRAVQDAIKRSQQVAATKLAGMSKELGLGQ